MVKATSVIYADTGILPDRGPNQLWTKGGILYVPPAR